ncbi:histidine kinase [Nocardioides sp. AE5]|uniref:sensor histidine kinase n=1 Tax=Nocardioides sp. AE5 TaxID=2962573 RepID=UPI002881918D|nr:histidine kinase [Nocardioides sp. AE5]MDT0202282.1 histidine kinase [Nocardioides sp. AE5]
MINEIRPLGPATITRVDRPGIMERLRVTGLGLGLALAMPVTLLLGILSLLVWPLLLVVVGFGLAQAVVPASHVSARLHRAVASRLLAAEIPAECADTTGLNPFSRSLVWLRDPARWRDFAHLWFASTGGLVMSALPAMLIAGPVVHVIGFLISPGSFWMVLLFLSGPMLLAWWFVTLPLARARATADRAILGVSRIEQLEQRVAEVAESRTEALDHSAAEVRRIERDLHDGAQARIATVGMNVGLAEKLMATDPEAAAELLREAREATVSALEDLRTVVRGIHPPVLADRGLVGAVEALAVALPLPVTVSVEIDPLPAPVESALYFAVAECLANTMKHSEARRAWISGSHDGTRARIVVGDDGVGGANPNGLGLTGVAKRLGAFDGTMELSSPPGGPTEVTMEVPCPTSPSGPS